MRASLVFQSAFSILIFSLALAGCSKSGPAGIRPIGVDDDGGVGRTFTKLDAAAEVAPEGSGGDAGSPEVNDQDAEGDSGGTDGAGPKKGAGLPPIITVTVDPLTLVPPPDGGVPAVLIVPANYGPSPMVTVMVVSQSGNLLIDDVSGVTVAIIDPLTGAMSSSTKLARTDSDSVPGSDTTRFIFSGVPIDLTKLATGEYGLVFTATTVGGVSGSTKLSLWVDTGPVIVVNSPTEGRSYKGSAPVEVNVSQTKFAITQVTVSIGQGDPIPLTQSRGSVYKGNIDFTSFVPPLEGIQLATFRATNENGTQATVQRRFVSDNAGPTISATTPALGDMIGSVISIKATVVDPAGVDVSSIVAVVGNGDKTFEVALLPGGGGTTYTNLFDTTKLPSYALYPTISFRARDVLGNESLVSYLLTLDNEPPVIDLAPAYVREITAHASGPHCTWAFDPVGPDAVDDGDLVPQLFSVRARVEDKGNQPLTGATEFELIAGVDPAQVKFFLLANTSRPLLVDTSDPPDGVCDDINPELVPTTKPKSDLDAQVVNMVPLDLHRGADFSGDPSAPICSGYGTNSTFPGCPNTENLSKTQWDLRGIQHEYRMSLGMTYSVRNDLPSIYTLGPVMDDDMQCAGRPFDASNNLKNGWACLAVKATDKLGNMQVSPPLRACVLATPSTTDCTEFRTISRLVSSDPLEIQTSTPLLGLGGVALKAGDEVIVSGVLADPSANGRWPVDPLDTTGTRFALRGNHGRPLTYCVCDSTYTDIESCRSQGSPSCPGIPVKLQLTPGQPIVVVGSSKLPAFSRSEWSVFFVGNTEQSHLTDKLWKTSTTDGTSFTLLDSKATDPNAPGGRVVPVSVLPDCTGTVIQAGKDGGLPSVDATKPCKPWKTEFPVNKAFPLASEPL
jgi:hypothetical protein